MIKILAGDSSLSFGKRVADAYGTELVPTTTTRFSDGEFAVSIEQTVRGKEVVIVQSTFPPSDNLFELLLLIDAAKRASAKRIIAVMPYFGMARQDRKDKPRVNRSETCCKHAYGCRCRSSHHNGSSRRSNPRVF